MRLLVVEDNHAILANLVAYLELQGYTVDCAHDGLTALHLAATQPYDLIVLDVMLPGADGLSVCRALRAGQHSTTPVIMLTARDALDDRLHGFDSGADDYLTKPFAMAELAARIEAVLRRVRGAHRLLIVDALRYDLDTLAVSRAGQRIQLAPAALKVLELLMRRSPAVVRREELEGALWGDSPPDSDSLRSHIHQLRQHIDRPYDYPLLHTVHGVGYRLARE